MEKHKGTCKAMQTFSHHRAAQWLLRMLVKYTAVRALARLSCLLPHLSTGCSEMGFYTSQ